MQKISKVSFDYDGSLDSNLVLQDLCALYLSQEREVYILTSRSPEIYRNTDLFLLAEKIGVKRENILFAFAHSKSELITQHSIDVHYDNDPHVIHEINSNLGASKGILVHYSYISNDIHDG